MKLYLKLLMFVCLMFCIAGVAQASADLPAASLSGGAGDDVSENPAISDLRGDAVIPFSYKRFNGFYLDECGILRGPTPTPNVTPTTAPTDTPIPTNTTGPGTPTYTPYPTDTSVPTETPTITPTGTSLDTGIYISLNQDGQYVVADTMEVYVDVINRGVILPVTIYIAINVGDTFYFWPSFTTRMEIAGIDFAMPAEAEYYNVLIQTYWFLSGGFSGTWYSAMFVQDGPLIMFDTASFTVE